MRVQIKPTYQVQRINQLLNQLEKLRTEEFKQMVRRPDQKSWSPIEVMKHMIIAHMPYQQKVNTALAAMSGGTENVDPIQASVIPSRLMKMFPPKEGKIRFKMKTGKKFKPVLDVDALSVEDVDAIYLELEDSLKELKSWVEQYRSGNGSMKRFNSAVGPIVRFNIPEACEFILCHNERHFLQVWNTLAK